MAIAHGSTAGLLLDGFNLALFGKSAQLDPLQDPAVLVMGAFIAFHTNADVNSYGGYRRLIQRCADRDQLYKDQMNDAH